MTKTISVETLLKSRSSLARLFAQPLNARMGYILSRIQRQLDPEIEAAESARIQICNKHGKVNPQTQHYEFGENQTAFETEISTFFAEKVKIDAPEFKMEDFETIRLSATDYTILAWLIDFEQPTQQVAK